MTLFEDIPEGSMLMGSLLDYIHGPDSMPKVHLYYTMGIPNELGQLEFGLYSYSKINGNKLLRNFTEDDQEIAGQQDPDDIYYIPDELELFDNNILKIRLLKCYACDANLYPHYALYDLNTDSLTYVGQLQNFQWVNDTDYMYRLKGKVQYTDEESEFCNIGINGERCRELYRIYQLEADAVEEFKYGSIR